MAKKKKSEQLRGAHRMRENGMKLVQVWLDPSELAVIVEAAELVGRKLATFVREAAFGSAGVLLNHRDNGHPVDGATMERMVNAEPVFPDRQR